MLTDQQRTLLGELVLSFIGFGPDATLLTTLAGPDVARQAPSGVNGFRVADWLVELALERPDPALFVRVAATANAAGIVAELHVLVERLRADPSGWRGRAVDELWVPDPPRLPFVDRSRLRMVLQDMAMGAGPAAVTVAADEGHGKRTVCDYIRQVAARTGRFRVVVERELRAETRADVVPRIVFDLRRRYGMSPPPGSTHREPERSGRVLAEELARQIVLEAPPVPVWLVVNLVDPVPESEVLAFLDELLRRVQQDAELAGRLRLVLLTDDFTRFALRHLPPAEHRHALPEVDEAAIAEWLAAAAPGKSPARYAIALEEVLAGVASRRLDAAQRLQWLARHCEVAHHTLTRVP